MSTIENAAKDLEMQLFTQVLYLRTFVESAAMV